MTSVPHVIAVIPARGGSKGIPRKNVRVVGGLPLIAHSVLAARAVPEVAAVYVSTDDAEIAEMARRYGADIIERPAELSGDTATSESALVHALDSLAARRLREPDIVVFLQPTSPLRQPDDVGNALRTFIDQQADSLFSATRATGFMWRCGPQGPSPLDYDPVARPRRQDAPLDVIENGSIYIFKPAVLRRHRARLGGKIAIHLMRGEDSFQVDEPWELELIDWLARKRFDSPSQPGASSVALASDSSYFKRRVTEAAQDFESTYWRPERDPDGVTRDRTAERDLYLSDLKQELAFIRTLAPGRVLDVGCGLGFLLSAFPEAWERHGVEVSAFGAERARAFAQVHHGDLASAAYPDRHFDLVVMHHVIEHVTDPPAVIREVFRILKPGGRLLIGTPDFDGAMARRFGDKYRLLHDQTHVSLFSNDSMHRFLRDFGFVIDHVDYPFFETRHFTKENLLRLFDTSQVSPAFYGSFMTFYCTKPEHADTRASLVTLRRVAEQVMTTLDGKISDAGNLLALCVARGNKILACGNGGSAADAQHFVAELVGRLKAERRALPSISLSSDPSVVTCVANDYGYDQLFARQVEALGQPGDVLLAISTSGRSANVLNAARAARNRGISVVALTGSKGDQLASLSDVCLAIPTTDTQCIQELHMAVLHVLCGVIDQRVTEQPQ